MANIGIVHDYKKEFEWRIDDFFSIPEEPDKCYCSSSFLFAGESWYLGIYPNGQQKINSVGFIELYLFRMLDGPSKKLTFTFSLKTPEEETEVTHVFEKAVGCGIADFCLRSKILEKKSELIPPNTLTIFFSVSVCKKATDDADNKRVSKCSYCKEDFSTNYISTHEQKCLAKPIECPDCKEKVDVRKCFDHECQLAKMKGTEKLVDDLRNAFHTGQHSDVTIIVKNEEFQLHRCILAARNSFFNAMFTSEMKENVTGIVTIDDCKPDVFRSFIHFVYTGKVNELSVENVCELYEVADKYQEDQLKAECLCFMKNKMSVDTFFDFLVLALIHDEKDLLKNATELFCRNVKEIIRNVKWQNFVKEYPIQANELNIKAFDYIMPSK